MVRIRNVNNNSVRKVKTVDVDKLNGLVKQRDKYKSERDSLIKDVEQQRELLKDFSRFIHRKVEACPGKPEYMDFRDSLKKLGITERE